MLNKIKGVVVFILGIAWIILVFKFDDLAGKPRGFGVKAGICLTAGLIAVINGIRIYRRKDA